MLDRRTGPGGEVVLRRHGDLLQIIVNGCFLMDTSDGRSERVLVRSALAGLPRGTAPDAPRLLIGGLGVGFSLDEAASQPRWGSITVVEREPAILDWHRRGPLAEVSGRALADPRTRLVKADLLDFLRAPAPDADRYDALCLDIDNGPDWTVTEGNEGLYSPAGLAACAARLNPGGVLAVWSARPSPAFEDALRHSGYQRVATEEIPVVRGVPDVVHLAVRPA
ncbi:spermidine synthase [Streptomyces durbertensis]|uniref:Spermidine synthase n=1 Tax=Streptomyces durbertensis TaxID=2448886 RepID=A0ABR6ECP0_9ACTN|nr:spermidine synthase [Streptomyces durbertensis]